MTFARGHNIDTCRGYASLDRAERSIGRMPPSPGRLFAAGYLARLNGDYDSSAVLLEEAFRAGADTVLTIIKRSKKGVDTNTLITKTGYDRKKVANIIYKLKKQRQITTSGKGVYVKA